MSSTPKVHVLLVDDDEQLLETLAAMLGRDDDVFVTTESSVPAALDTFDEAYVDCIVSDYDLPGMDGLDFLTAVRWHSTDVPFILTTGYGNERIASEAVRFGATDYIVKEGDWFDDLIDHVQSAVGARTEGKLSHTNTRFQRAIDAVDGYAIIMLDRHGRVMTWNAGAEALTGRDESVVLGECIHDLFVDEAAAVDLFATASDEGSATADHRLERGDGSTVRASGQVTRVDGALSDLRYFSAVLHEAPDCE